MIVQWHRAITILADHSEISINIWFFCHVFMQPQGANYITREKGLIGHETLQSSQ